MPFCCTHNRGQEPHDERYNEPNQLDDQQSREQAQSDANADHNQHEFGVISKIGNGVPPVENLAQLREGHKENGRNRDEDPKPTMHRSIVSEKLSDTPDLLALARRTRTNSVQPESLADCRGFLHNALSGPGRPEPND